MANGPAADADSKTLRPGQVLQMTPILNDQCGSSHFGHIYLLTVQNRATHELNS